MTSARAWMDRFIDSIEWIAAFFVGIVALNTFTAVSATAGAATQGHLILCRSILSRGSINHAGSLRVLNKPSLRPRCGKNQRR